MVESTFFILLFYKYLRVFRYADLTYSKIMQIYIYFLNYANVSFIFNAFCTYARGQVSLIYSK